jgi:phage terminase Nu1 subunit (DNA packaging protein)
MTEFSINALSGALGMDRRTLGDRFRDIEPSRVEGKAKLFSLIQILTALAADFLPEDADVDLNEAKRRRELALAQLAELDLQERRGEVINADEVENTWATVIVNVRSRLLSLPTKAAPLLQGVTGLAETNEVLKGLIYEALRELSASNFYLPEPDDEQAG